MACTDGSKDDAGPTTTSTAADETSEEVIQLLEAVDTLPVEPADGDTVPEPPPDGFDCDAIASQVGPSVVDPAGLLVAAAQTESVRDQELISAAQINVADGLSACAGGDMVGAALHFASARAAVDLIEGSSEK